MGRPAWLEAALAPLSGWAQGSPSPPALAAVLVYRLASFCDGHLRGLWLTYLFGFGRGHGYARRLCSGEGCHHPGASPERKEAPSR